MCKRIKTTYSCNHSTSTTEYCAENPSPSTFLRPRPASGSSGFSVSSWGSSFLATPTSTFSSTHKVSRQQKAVTLICRDCEREFLRVHLTALRREVESLGVRRDVKDDVTVLGRDRIAGTPPPLEGGSTLTRRGIEEGKRLSFASQSTGSGTRSRPGSGGILWDFAPLIRR